ncbi:GRAM domain-containing protein [Sporomusa aerivorans]|uniref:GRAM domain-containing protein n=1 Tax=Sporomusa aerivorans TaxID=204936 RepID=UPI00352BD0C8
MYSFPLEDEELILKKCLASYSCDGNVLNGALYLTDHRLVFVGYALSINNKYMDEVLLTHIKEILPEKTFLIIPNVLKVITIKDKVIKFVVKGRDEWLEAINKQSLEVN